MRRRERSIDRRYNHGLIVRPLSKPSPDSPTIASGSPSAHRRKQNDPAPFCGLRIVFDEFGEAVALEGPNNTTSPLGEKEKSYVSNHD